MAFSATAFHAVHSVASMDLFRCSLDFSMQLLLSVFFWIGVYEASTLWLGLCYRSIIGNVTFDALLLVAYLCDHVEIVSGYYEGDYQLSVA